MVNIKEDNIGSMVFLSNAGVPAQSKKLNIHKNCIMDLLSIYYGQEVEQFNKQILKFNISNTISVADIVCSYLAGFFFFVL